MGKRIHGGLVASLAFVLCQIFLYGTENPNLLLPPDATPSSTLVSWKGNSYTVLTDTSGHASAIPSSSTGLFNITPLTTPSTPAVTGTFPVTGSSGNVLYRGYASITSSPSWVRTYCLVPPAAPVTNSGASTGYSVNDFLLYSKEAPGGPANVNGWYVGPGFSYNEGMPPPPYEFSTLSAGSLITPSTTVVTPGTADRSTTSPSPFLLIASTETSALSTFYLPPEGSQVISLASTTAFEGLGSNLLLLAEVAQYIDPGVPTPTPSNFYTAKVASLFTGSGSFNRDPNSSIYQSYATPACTTGGTLLSNSYYQYAEYASNPAGSLTSATLNVPAGTLLEFAGSLTLANMSSVSGAAGTVGTVLFSGSSDTLTLDSTSTFTPYLLVVEAGMLNLVNSDMLGATVSPGGFDLISGSALNIGSQVTLNTTPGTTWHGDGPGTIPAVPAGSSITGAGTLILGTPLSTSTPGTWANYGSITVENLTLNASSAATTLINHGQINVGNLSLLASAANPYILASGTLSATTATLQGDFQNFGNFEAANLILANEAQFSNGGGSGIGTLTLNGGGSYTLNPGAGMAITTLMQGSNNTMTHLMLSGSQTPVDITNWTVSGSITMISTHAVTNTDSFALSSGILNLTGSGIFNVNNSFTIAAGSSFTWDHVLFSLAGIVRSGEGSIVAGGEGSTLSISSNLTLDGISISADNLAIPASYFGIGGKGAIAVKNDIDINGNTQIALSQDITLQTSGAFNLGGYLQGPGTLIAQNGVSVIDGATLAAAVQLGDTLTVQGDLTFSPEAIFIPLLTANNFYPKDIPSNASSFVVVEGDAYLAGFLALNNNSPIFRHGATYPILKANNIYGQFDSVVMINGLAPGYTFSTFVNGDPTLFLSVRYLNPLTMGVTCRNPLHAASALNTVLLKECYDESLYNFLVDNLIPSLIGNLDKATEFFEQLGGSEYAAIGESWMETQFQGLFPWQDWLWQAACEKRELEEQKLEKKSPYWAWSSVSGSGIWSAHSHCGNPRWSGANGSATFGLVKWEREQNSFFLGAQDELLHARAKNGAQGMFQINALELVAVAKICQPQNGSFLYGTFITSAGGGWGNMKRRVSFGGFSSALEGKYGLFTYKGSAEGGWQWGTSKSTGQIYGTAYGVGNWRSGITESGKAVNLSASSQNLGALRTGIGFRIKECYQKKTITIYPEFSLQGYWQAQFGGDQVDLLFGQSSCGFYSQIANGLSPWGAVGSLAFTFQNNNHLSVKIRGIADISSHVQTAGAELALSKQW